ncbi:MAG: hypothetical protein H0T89_33405 [Deltaproteobacteria bacterium]|nr:hypothetical protein [Deltaproteobacteria bacterium]MDQ3301702.1 hypothetical protein [Myxococcota bacterium]
MHPVAAPERRRLLDKLIREISRSESQAIEHAPREAKRVGEVPPIAALREVAQHAGLMRTRFETLLHGHDITINRAGLGATLSTLRSLVVDRVVDPERAYRTALLDLRHGIDVVKLLREIARAEGLFGVIRWCDDWLGARRTQVARVEAQLVWYAEHADLEIGHPAGATESKSFEAENAQDNVASDVSALSGRSSILDFK